MSARPGASFLRALLFALACAIATAILDLTLFRQLDIVALTMMRRLPPILAPIWLALPRVVVFSLVGMCFQRWHRGSLLFGATAYVALLVLYFFAVRFGGGIWVADDWLSRLTAYVPIAAAPVCFIGGVVVAYHFGWGGAKTRARET